MAAINGAMPRRRPEYFPNRIDDPNYVSSTYRRPKPPYLPTYHPLAYLGALWAPARPAASTSLTFDDRAPPPGQIPHQMQPLHTPWRAPCLPGVVCA